MAIILIGYDKHEGEDYGPLEAGIKKLYPTWWHALDSTWLVETGDSPSIVRQRLKPFFEAADSLLVIDVSAALASWQGFGGNAEPWMASRLRREA